MEILSIFAGLIVLLSVGILIYCIKDRFYEYLFVLILNVIMSFISIFLLSQNIESDLTLFILGCSLLIYSSSVVIYLAHTFFERKFIRVLANIMGILITFLSITMTWKTAFDKDNYLDLWVKSIYLSSIISYIILFILFVKKGFEFNDKFIMQFLTVLVPIGGFFVGYIILFVVSKIWLLILIIFIGICVFVGVYNGLNGDSGTTSKPNYNRKKTNCDDCEVKSCSKKSSNCDKTLYYPYEVEVDCHVLETFENCLGVQKVKIRVYATYYAVNCEGKEDSRTEVFDIYEADAELYAEEALRAAQEKSYMGKPYHVY